MASQVYFCDLRSSIKRPLWAKIDDLIEKAGLPEVIKPGKLTAIKLHFGEKGNTAFVRPVLVRRFVDAVKKAGGKPFITDANTLYVGARGEAVSHLQTAVTNGFAYSVVDAPLVIADGLKGTSATAVKVDLPECEHAYIGSELVEADCLVSVAHFKGHEVTGFGGTIKNLGMGAAARRGKLFMHANIAPSIKTENCVACGICVERCRPHALKLVKRLGPAPAKAERPEFMAQRDDAKCIGCGDCILACPESAIHIPWDAQVTDLLKRMAAYTKGVLAGKEKASVCFNFLTQISPACDCYPHQDAPIVADIGILASRDPVAIDQASVDLVNQAPGLTTSCLKSGHAPGEDKFRALWPKTDYTVQLSYAEEIGLGSRDYKLIKID